MEAATRTIAAGVTVQNRCWRRWRGRKERKRKMVKDNQTISLLTARVSTNDTEDENDTTVAMPPNQHGRDRLDGR